MSSSSSYSPIISKLFKSRNIILNILKQRGFDVEDYEHFSLNDVVAMYNAVPKQLDMLLEDKKGKKIYVKYSITAARIRHKNIQEAMEDLYELEEILGEKDELLMIGKEKINDNVKSYLKEIFRKTNRFINIYNFNDYLFNILEHSLVPPHKILTDDEKKKVYKQYNITNDSQFPEISRFDPVASALGMRPGDLCKIERPSPTAITSTYYRLCIH